ncbi:MAG TPA: type I glyceraldehyde-3-phosphate dehydrogenase [Candidatus Paceibacterota bacterium]|nr:type I glyceraldehyde-3-phosphate dehydrogenase [Candidatus Paceibacterota bacterium]HPT40479.1 type I glyceraldehyde-3-phosphate dehydrogenase [Candidatus Paceibacterota bacterium]
MKIAINGLGRIGRAFLKLVVERPEIEVVAINDLGDLDNLAYLLKYDSVYGRYYRQVSVEAGFLMIGGFDASVGVNSDASVGVKKIKFLQEKDPTKLPWKDLGIDIVVESTGVFETFEKAQAHIVAGAKRVVITAPSKDDDLSLKLGATSLCGLNEENFAKVKITSNGSCTTNAVAPVMAILSEALGIKKALLNTTHAYTASQKIVDGPDTKDWRRGRAGAINLVPSTTGAAVTVGKVIQSLNGIFDGISVRTPVSIVSLADITFVSSRPTSVEEVNKIMKDAAANPRWQGIFKAIEEPLVSTDLLGDIYPSIADLSCTKVAGGDLVKIFVWYDNELGYSNSLVDHIMKAGKIL